MARPREFDVERALDRGMYLLWRNGYEATSLGQLTREMRLSKSSFYSTFGSKRRFLLAALTRYTDRILDQLAADLEHGSARDAIVRSFESALRVAGGSRGCFVQNCAIELAHRDPLVRARVRQAFDRLQEGYRRAVLRGRRTGEFRGRSDARTLARYLTATLNGVQFLSRAGANRPALDSILPVVVSALR